VKKKAILILGMLLLTVVPDLSALNLQIDRDDHRENGRFDEDYLFYDDQLQFRGTAKDLIFIGQNLDFYGQLSLGLLAGGRTVNAQANRTVLSKDSAVRFHPRWDDENHHCGQMVR
jgi:hypothetical protein